MTPALILDQGVMKRNIQRMADRAAELGVPLRPHLKTPKSAAIAQLMLERQCQGITVSTLREAEYFLDSGITDIFYAVPLAPSKVRRIAELIRRGAELLCLIDNLQAATIVMKETVKHGVTLSCLVEIDVDHYRTGISQDSPDFLAIGRLLDDSPNCQLAGVMAYGGASYGCDGPAAIAKLAERFRTEMLRARDQLLEIGLSCPRLSFGSTPAVKFAKSMAGITELRCGIYVFEDLFQAGIGACEIKDIAVSVLTTVIGAQSELNRLVVDAGGLALSKDRSTQGTSFDAGFGLVCEANSGAVINDLYVATVSQELGLITTQSSKPIDFDKFPIGGQLRILPNHADMTAAAYNEYQVVDGSDVILDVWQRTNGW